MTDTLTPTLDITRLTDFLWTGGDLPDPLSDAKRVIRTWRAIGVGAIVDNRIESSNADLAEAVDPGDARLVFRRRH